MPNPRLNILAKSLFLRFLRYTQKERKGLKYYLKFPKISKEFLRAATLYKVYCLRLSSGYPNRFLATIENSNEKLLSSSCGTFICNCENLQNLSRWLHISFIEAIFGYFDPSTAEKYVNGQIVGYRRVWNEIYPDAKIKLCVDKDLKYKVLSDLVGELSSRLYALESPPNIILNAEAIEVDFCLIKKAIDLKTLKRVLMKHKIKELKIELCKDDETPILIPFQYLDDFPSNVTLKRLEIGYKTNSEKEEDLGAITSLLHFFPRMTTFCLSLKHDKQPANGFTLNQISEIANNALDHIRQLRHDLSKERPSIELEIYSSFRLTVNTTAKKFKKWAKALILHQELAEANHIEPAFYFHPDRILGLDNMRILGKSKKYYLYREYYLLALKWTRKNFTGIFYLFMKSPEED